jgi:hypothetical protein
VEYLDALDYSFDDTGLQQLCENLQNSVVEETVVAPEVVEETVVAPEESSPVPDKTQSYDESVVNWNPVDNAGNPNAEPPPPSAPATSSEEEVDMSSFRRERKSRRRVIKVPSRLTYDRPGKPSMRRTYHK